jgi:hypothetical protein
MGFALFGSSSTSRNTTTNTTVTKSATDSYNRSFAKNSVLDNVGNVSLSFGQPLPPSTLERYLPAVALGLLVLYALKNR